MTKLSSAGLIYRHFGKEVISNAAKDNWGVELSATQLEKVYEHIYESLILEVDANDNGVAVSDEPRYRVSSGLPSRVGRCNSEWNAPKEKSQHVQFKKAMKIAEEEFMYHLHGQVLVKLPGFNIVKEAWDKKEEFHSSGELMELTQFAPWKEFVFEIEAEQQCEGKLKFAITKDGRGLWKVMAVPPKPNTFDIRVPLHIDWRGLRNKELQEKSGITDAEFVHRAGFIGGAWSKESAIKMAEISIKDFNEAK